MSDRTAGQPRERGGGPEGPQLAAPPLCIPGPATFGLSEQANLDEGAMWPVAFALKELTAADEARIGALVEKALS